MDSISFWKRKIFTKNMTYNIHIYLTDGREVNASVTSKDQSSAIERLMEQDVFKDFLGDADIERVSITPVEDNSSSSRYVLQPSDEDGWWVCTDTKNLFIVRFKEHHFNETQQLKLIDDTLIDQDALNSATLLRQMADWLRDNHYNIIF